MIGLRRMAFVLPVLVSLALPGTGLAGWTERSSELLADRVDFGAVGGGNENYYDGDFADYDLDGRMDRALIARYGLLWNRGGGEMFPVSVQRLDLATGVATNQPPNDSLPNLTGYIYGDGGNAGNDGVQWADIDGDGDPDSIQGGNGEPFVMQANRAGRFSVVQRLSGSALNITNTDIDNDGDVDFAVAHAFCSSRNCGGPVDFRLWVNDGSGNFSDETVARGLGQYRSECQLVVGVASGDVDGDGDFDLVMAVGAYDPDRCAWPGGVPAPRNAIIVNINDGIGNYTERVATLNRDPADLRFIGSGFGQLTQLGDVDGDGDLDFVLVGAPNEDPDFPGAAFPIGEHPMVSHVLMINDGDGNFVEESLTRWNPGSAASVLVGENAKLVDFDYDGDLDYVAFDKPGPIFFNAWENDGAGVFTYRPDLDPGGWQALDKLGVDVDISDLDADGTYDLWIGVAKLPPNLLINDYQTPSGIRADMPRNPRIESADASAIVLSWEHPPFASMNRHYRVLRSLAVGAEARDRPILRVIALSPHEDDSFAAPITEFTTTADLAAVGVDDVELDGANGRVTFTDRSAVPGVRYRYSVVHVGTERNAGAPTWELEATIPHPDPAGADLRPPELAILAPTSEEWSAHPRLVIEYGDDLSGVDLASLRVSFDQPLGSGNPMTGGRAADADISDLFFRQDDGTHVYRLERTLPLPQGLATLTVSVRDLAGNLAMTTSRLNVTLSSPEYPLADFDWTQRPTNQVIDFDGEASRDTDPDIVQGANSYAASTLIRWEWSFGDGTTGIGHDAWHRYRDPGDYEVRLLVRDDQGGVDVLTRTVTVTDIDADTDGDGRSDREEIDDETDPDRSDTDADGVDDFSDCRPLDGRVATPPLEVSGLRVAGNGLPRLTWQGGVSAGSYQLLRGSLTTLRASGIVAAATCAIDALAATDWDETDPVLPAGGAFYLVRAGNDCGTAGDWGSDSQGSPRLAEPCP